MEIILRLGFIAFVFTTFTTTAFAYECNTVMGGCPTNSGQVTSSHMIGSATKMAPQGITVKPATNTPNAKNTAAQVGAGKKTGQAPLLQTINKNILK